MYYNTCFQSGDDSRMTGYHGLYGQARPLAYAPTSYHHKQRDIKSQSLVTLFLIFYQFSFSKNFTRKKGPQGLCYSTFITLTLTTTIVLFQIFFQIFDHYIKIGQGFIPVPNLHHKHYFTRVYVSTFLFFALLVSSIVEEGCP